MEVIIERHVVSHAEAVITDTIMQARSEIHHYTNCSVILNKIPLLGVWYTPRINQSHIVEVDEIADLSLAWAQRDTNTVAIMLSMDIHLMAFLTPASKDLLIVALHDPVEDDEPLLDRVVMKTINEIYTLAVECGYEESIDVFIETIK